MSKLQDFIRRNIKLPKNMYTRIKDDGVVVGYHDLVFWFPEDKAAEYSDEDLKEILEYDIKFLEDQRKASYQAGYKEFTC